MLKKSMILQYLSKIEYEYVKYGIDLLFRIFECLGIDITEIMKESNIKKIYIYSININPSKNGVFLINTIL